MESELFESKEEGEPVKKVSRLYWIPTFLGFALIIDTIYYDWLDIQSANVFHGWMDWLLPEFTTAYLGILILLYTTWRVLSWPVRESD